MNDLQQAMSDAISDLSAGQDAWAFGANSFPGAASALKPDDPRMAGSPDRLIELVVITTNLPKPFPLRGHELITGVYVHVVHRVDHDTITGLSTFLVSRTTKIKGSTSGDFSAADFSSTDFST